MVTILEVQADATTGEDRAPVAMRPMTVLVRSDMATAALDGDAAAAAAIGTAFAAALRHPGTKARADEADAARGGAK